MVVVNCDEFYVCLMVIVVCWLDVLDIIGGIDFEVGGIWFGISIIGCFVVVINVCELGMGKGVCFCGELMWNFLFFDLFVGDYV